ncbi:hypothetical protein [Xanthocytophaga flava]|nr:hypothetical protein [Xanthocytophaga flavus]MDJ1473395.1 hypothetical protein [Xanthocytophaga flavus]
MPPFHPNRVESCLYYQLEEGSYTLKVMTKPPTHYPGKYRQFEQ